MNQQPSFLVDIDGDESWRFIVKGMIYSLKEGVKTLYIPEYPFFTTMNRLKRLEKGTFNLRVSFTDPCCKCVSSHEGEYEIEEYSISLGNIVEEMGLPKSVWTVKVHKIG